MFVSGQLFSPPKFVWQPLNTTTRWRQTSQRATLRTQRCYQHVNKATAVFTTKDGDTIEVRNSSDQLPPCWKSYHAICKKHLHNPRSALVTHGQLLRIPHRWPNLCWGGFHTSETWWLVRVTYKTPEKHIYTHTFIPEYHNHNNISYLQKKISWSL